MSIYLCREGHKHRSQESATNCGYCKANDRKIFQKNRDKSMKKLVFVYGTLLRGLSNYQVMENSNGKFICKDKIRGRMFNFTVGFPFITLQDPFNYLVHGEVFEVDHFQFLDRLEGYDENRPGNFYSRSIVKTLSGLDVCVYHIEGYPKPCNWIISGDWKEWKHQLVQGTESRFTTENTLFPLPKKGTYFYVKLLDFLEKNAMYGSIAVPPYAYRSIEYASEKTGIKIHRQYSKEYGCYLISIPQGGTISKTIIL